MISKWRRFLSDSYGARRTGGHLEQQVEGLDWLNIRGSVGGLSAGRLS